MTMEQLIQEGTKYLEAKKSRDAIAALKFAVKKYGESDNIRSLLFRAYLLREKQLRKKNMITEADAVRKQALEYMPNFQELTEEALCDFIATCSDNAAYDAYEKYIAIHQKAPKIEQFLANRLFKKNNWEFVSQLDESNPLRRDAIPVQNAIDMMNQGKWEEALDMLQPIPRTSPFAPVRLFSRAMVSFYTEDDADTFKALSMIPDNFPLINVVNHLKNIVANPAQPDAKKESMAQLASLWDGAINIGEGVPKLLEDLEEQRFGPVKHFISELAESVYPQDPMAARAFILEVLWTIILQNNEAEYFMEEMTVSLLPLNMSELLLLKTEWLKSQTPFTSAGKYISMLEREFSDSEARQIAHGFILQDIVLKSLEFKDRINIMGDKKGIVRYGELLGIKSVKMETILVEIAAESIRLDPCNRQGYELIVRLPRSSRPAKQAVESMLVAMQKIFPDDPFPCFELARLYYETNAYRKAENILAEAKKRAPHDNRVIDQHALGLLISAEKNLKKGKLHLVEKDLERVRTLSSKKMLLFIIEKRILFQIVKNHHDLKTEEKSGGVQASLFDTHKDIRTIWEDELNALPLFERLRTLAILMSDIKLRKKFISDKGSLINSLEKVIDKELKQIHTLSSTEITKLLMPLKKKYEAIFAFQKVAPIFLDKWKDILKKIKDAEMIPLYDIILDPEFMGLIKTDIQRRIKKANPKYLLQLKFHLLVIEHLSGKKHTPDDFYYIIDQAKGNMVEELRAISRRLSKHASGTFKKALELFDFDILEAIHPEFDEEMAEILSLSGEDEEGIDKLVELLDVLEPYPGAIEKEVVDEALEDFELFIDDMGIREMPEFMIQELREMMRKDAKTRREFDMLKKLIEKSKSISRLSREARIILFGKGKK